MRKAIVVGSGAGGATVAKELQGPFDVTLLEAGKEFNPFAMSLSTVELVKKAGLLFDEREIPMLFPAMKIRKTPDRMVLVKGIALGGTTTLATGNGVRADEALRNIGINLDREFEELEHEIPISTDHQRRWHKSTRRLFEICQELGLRPEAMPKMGDARRCINCGRCVLGCAHGAKWDSRQFVGKALQEGAKLVTGASVERVVISGGRAVGVRVRRGLHSAYYPADLVVLAAGGFGTPVILENTGIECEKSLFVDPVLCVATEWKGCLQCNEITMPFVVQKEGFILSPYFDYLSFFFNRGWKYQANDTLVMMVKIADTGSGSIKRKNIDKVLSNQDRERLKTGVDLCMTIFDRLGTRNDGVVLGTVNAGHPGGMLPLTEREAVSFHHDRLPENLYVADASLFPSSLGNPPMLTIMAMAKRVARVCLQ